MKTAGLGRSLTGGFAQTGPSGGWLFSKQPPRRPAGTPRDENSRARSAHSGVLRKDRPEQVMAAIFKTAARKFGHVLTVRPVAIREPDSLDGLQFKYMVAVTRKVHVQPAARQFVAFTDVFTLIDHVDQPPGASGQGHHVQRQEALRALR